MTIQQLSDHVINCIAAGEVIERPAAVVRELVENSLDAGARVIAVTVEDGGHTRIVVSDDGHGIARNELQLACLRHTTSKLHTVHDLESIATRGFRGEALASIGAVSRMRVISRVEEADVASVVEVEGGAINNHVQTAARTVGTTVEVRALFFSSPVRRSFMKSPKVELAKIEEAITALALSSPEVRFTLEADGESVLSLGRHSTLHERAHELFSCALVPFSVTRRTKEGRVITIAGALSHPTDAARSRHALVFLVNSRPVNDKVLLRAVREGYLGMVKPGEYPRGVLSVCCDPRDVDVNIHPQKHEVRFRDSAHVFVAVRGAVEEALRSLSAPLDATPEQLGEAVTSYSTSIQTISFGDAPYADLERGSEVKGEARALQLPGFGEVLPWRFCGQFLGCYLVFDSPDEVLFVDMHAAHERIQFNRLRAAATATGVSSQQLLEPLVIEGSAEIRESVVHHEAEFRRFGFVIEPFGPDAVTVRALPPFVSEAACEELLYECCSSDGNPSWGAIEGVLLASLARRACHASIRGGDTIRTAEEASALLEGLFAAESGGACPHGRPAVVRHRRAAIEQWFGRDH